MKRFMAAFVIAALIHVLVFVADDRWFIRRLVTLPKTDVITMRLVAHAPATPAIHSLPAAPPPLPPKPKPPAAKQKPVTKTKPKVSPKPVEKKVQPVAKKQPDKQVPPPPPVPIPATAEPEPEVTSPPDSEITKTDPDSNAAPVGNRLVNATVIEATPRYSQNSPPAYPSIARKRGYEGTVVLDVFVKADGRVGDLRVVESSNYKALDKSAMKSVKSWRFEPGKKGEETVAMWVRVPVDFRLQ